MEEIRVKLGDGTIAHLSVEDEDIHFSEYLIKNVAVAYLSFEQIETLYNTIQKIKTEQTKIT